MLIIKLHQFFLSATLLAILLTGCAESGAPASLADKSVSLEVYKSPTCGCCGDWITHVEAAGFFINVNHEKQLDVLKEEKGITPQYQSCHTAVSKDGYIFEGHIPVKWVEKFLRDKPEGAIGLAVPGMPLGSPGMEIGDKFTPYQVLLLKEDGSSELYAEIKTRAEQY
jgi:hypothetical protein